MRPLWIAFFVAVCVAVAVAKPSKGADDGDDEPDVVNKGKPEDKGEVEKPNPPPIDPPGKDKRAAKRPRNPPAVVYDGKRDEDCGYGKAGGCEDQDGCDWHNYPNSIMCTAKDTWTATKFGFSCDTRDLILHLHDEYRKNSTVGGASSNEQKLYWDDCLAQQAQKLAQSCVFDHDSGAQRVYPNAGPTPGQNLGWGRGWPSVISAWISEKKSFTFNGNNVAAMVGHYTQAMHGDTSRIGCGYAYCKNEMLKDYYVCNYGNGQFASDIKTPWKSGKPCEACPDNCIDKEFCDCKGKMCHHGGRLNPRTCKCECPEAFNTDDECTEMDPSWQAKKCKKPDPGACGSDPYTKASCCKYSNLYAVCPHTCGICDADVNMGDPTGCQSTI